MMDGTLQNKNKLMGTLSGGNSIRGGVGTVIGRDGKSAYEVWLSEGNVGTVDEYLESLKGEKGDKGDPFRYADFTPEQLEMLKGEQGDKGETGAKGEKGDKGDTGEPFEYSDFTAEQLEALKGEKGDKGETGADGATGEKGEKGDKGDKGESGVYVGSGDMPDGYNVQIDPDGDSTTIRDIVDGVIAALPTWEGGSY